MPRLPNEGESVIANAQQSYRALMEFEIYGTEPTFDELCGIVIEFARLKHQMRKSTKRRIRLLHDRYARIRKSTP